MIHRHQQRILWHVAGGRREGFWNWVLDKYETAELYTDTQKGEAARACECVRTECVCRYPSQPTCVAGGTSDRPNQNSASSESPCGPLYHLQHYASMQMQTQKMALLGGKRGAPAAPVSKHPNAPQKTPSVALANASAQTPPASG